jgi:hypothetical protein
MPDDPTTWRADTNPTDSPLAQAADALRQKADQERAARAPAGCDLCGDATGALFLRSRCHVSAPLLARVEDDWLILSCYLPECGREVVRLQLAPRPRVSPTTAAASLPGAPRRVWEESDGDVE